MKKAILVLLCALLLFSLAACGDGDRPNIDVYRIKKNQDSALPYGLISENVIIEPGINPLSFIIAIINSESAQPDAEKPLPEGIYISGFEKQGKTLKLKLSGGFNNIKGPQKALAEAALIMTFTDFSDIELVSIEEGGKLIMSARGRNSILFEDTSIIIEK